MKCEQCSTELDAELSRFERMEMVGPEVHTQARCLQAQLSEAALKYRTDIDEASARISELEDTIDLAAAEDRVASSYGRSAYHVAVVNEIVERRGKEWTGAKTARALADGAAPEVPKPSAHARLVEALGYASTWPVTDVLRRLADAARHLLDVHNCDRTGWEEVSSCAKHADEIAAAIEAALAPASPAAPPSPGTTENLAEQLGALLAEAGIRPWFHKAGCSMWKGTRICDKGCGPPEKKP